MEKLAAESTWPVAKSIGNISAEGAKSREKQKYLPAFLTLLRLRIGEIFG